MGKPSSLPSPRNRSKPWQSRAGLEVIALVKAPQVIIVTDFGGYKVSARNQLPGTITQVKPGAVNTEVDIELKGGEQVTATVTNDSVDTLGLRKGQSATAIFKAGAVILAVAGWMFHATRQSLQSGFRLRPVAFN